MSQIADRAPFNPADPFDAIANLAKTELAYAGIRLTERPEYKAAKDAGNVVAGAVMAGALTAVAGIVMSHFREDDDTHAQIFANVYAGAVDRHLQQQLGERHWFRYMDDIVVLGRSSAHLRRVRDEIERLSRERLGLRFSKWSVQPVSRGVNFVGYRIWPTHKLLRRDSVVRARRRIASLRARGDADTLGRFVAAWTGHARWADSRNLLDSLELQQTGRAA